MTEIWIIDAFASMTVSLLLTLVVIPRILAFSRRRQLLDRPCSRKIHSMPVPRLGGVAFLPAIIVGLSLVAGINLLIAGNPMVIARSIVNARLLIEIVLGLCAFMLMYVIGLTDDIAGMRYKSKLIAQAIAAALIVSAGFTIGNLHGFIGIGILPTYIDLPLSMLVAMLIINAINFVDGIDGLASAACMAALSTYAVTFANHGEYVYLALALTCIGTLIPFFGFNMLGNADRGNKIFMGDTGALTMGAIIAVMSLKVCNLGSAASSQTLVVAFTPVMLPCLDAIRVVIVRLRCRRSPFLPDRCHMHHRLLAIGLSQHAALLAIILMTLSLMAVNLLLSSTISVTWIMSVDIALWLIINGAISANIHRVAVTEAKTTNR